MTLPRGERFEAFRDIAALTSRSIYAVQTAAYRLYSQDIVKSLSGSIAVPVRRVSGLSQPNTPSNFRWPSQAAKMAGKAPTRKHVIP